MLSISFTMEKYLFSRTIFMLFAFHWLAVAQNTTLHLNEGGICKRERSTVWTCRQVKDCPSKSQNLTNSGVCRSVDNEPLVCCQNQAHAEPTIGARAKAMCQKYAEAVYQPNLNDGLSDPHLIDTCVGLTLKQRATPGEFPHMVLIGYGAREDNAWLCSGSLVSERYVISAAHCTHWPSLGRAQWVRVGDFDILSENDDTDGFVWPMESRDYKITEFVRRLEFRDLKSSSENTPQRYVHDIALFKVDKDVKFNLFVRPICLQTDHEFDSRSTTIAGWFRTKDRDTGAGELNKIEISINESQLCSSHESKNSSAENTNNAGQNHTQLCATNIPRQWDSCQARSSGVLQVWKKDPYCMYGLVGILSSGPCSGEAVFTRVSSYVPWIESVVWP